ncbi:hypothetical protein BCL57_001275 [Agromyces flavus]|uniref:ABC transporter ATP-binding protein n=1 Tax=Agromyces flavus TaxID=589382 RepID=A0A1H1ZJA9_9MICO|nr:hypothetical protein [Agromyces flavus]MCP2367121.1 hypothetical protein [Agromyces flavus]GGI46358.1 hypothetical protein GCM10010932_14220 [Agromyces flavus]SDT33808.1 hypothetical protein SAMN04489721_3200 [Agromyces flavus]
MRIELHGVSKGRRGRALPATTIAFESGRATLATAETQQRPTVLGLLASGRMRPDAGAVEIDGRTDAAGLRRRVALVDAPDVSDPAPNVTVAGVAAEELMFAGVPSNPVSVARRLDQFGLANLARTPIANVDPEPRLRMLTELALLRDGVEGLVIVSPDRHGGPPDEWWRMAQRLADRGVAVLVIAGDASAAAIAASDLLDRLHGADLADEDDESALAAGGLA